MPTFDQSSVPRGRRPVFGVGLGRTGTTSLTAALEILGYRAVHYPPADRVWAHDLPWFDQWDAATDISVIPLIPDLDARYPDAAFILTVRDEAEWIRSVIRHRTRRGTLTTATAGPERARIREAVYGSAETTPDLLAEARRRHHERVRARFADRPGALLEIDITAGEGWEPLCWFLDVPIPATPFPWRNNGDEADRKLAPTG